LVAASLSSPVLSAPGPCLPAWCGSHIFLLLLLSPRFLACPRVFWLPGGFPALARTGLSLPRGQTDKICTYTARQTSTACFVALSCARRRPLAPVPFVSPSPSFVVRTSSFLDSSPGVRRDSAGTDTRRQTSIAVSLPLASCRFPFCLFPTQVVGLCRWEESGPSRTLPSCSLCSLTSKGSSAASPSFPLLPKLMVLPALFVLSSFHGFLGFLFGVCGDVCGAATRAFPTRLVKPKGQRGAPCPVREEGWAHPLTLASAPTARFTSCPRGHFSDREPSTRPADADGGPRPLGGSPTSGGAVEPRTFIRVPGVTSGSPPPVLFAVSCGGGGTKGLSAVSSGVPQGWCAPRPPPSLCSREVCIR
jgi:hypothetical protein